MGDDLFTEWFLTLFTFRQFPRDTALRVWDLLLSDGPKTLFRVALAILKLGQGIALLLPTLSLPCPCLLSHLACFPPPEALLKEEFEGLFTWTKHTPEHALLHPDAVISTGPCAPHGLLPVCLKFLTSFCCGAALTFPVTNELVERLRLEYWNQFA